MVHHFRCTIPGFTTWAEEAKKARDEAAEKLCHYLEASRQPMSLLSHVHNGEAVPLSLRVG